MAAEAACEEHEIFVPGRLCLFGEHSGGSLNAISRHAVCPALPTFFADWAGECRKENPEIELGKCIVCGTDQGLYARCSALSEPKFKMESQRCHNTQAAICLPKRYSVRVCALPQSSSSLDAEHNTQR